MGGPPFEERMDANLILGPAALLYGLFTLVLRFVAPQSRLFSKLEPMRTRWGHGPGTALHWFGYTLLPLFAGSVMVWASYFG